MTPFLALLAAQILVGPVKPATGVSYLIRADVSALVCGGATADDQTALAADPTTTGWRLQTEVWYVADAPPEGYPARSFAATLAAWRVHPETKVDVRQGGYERETWAGLATWGDVSKGLGVRYRTVRTVYACDSRPSADAQLAAVYSMGRALHLGERATIGGDWLWRVGYDPADPRHGLLPMRVAALDATAVMLPEVVSDAPPVLPVPPYDAADEVTGPDYLTPTKNDATRQKP